MNRRNFLASLVAVPAGVAAACVVKTAGGYPFPHHNGIAGILEHGGTVVQSRDDLDEAFKRAYAMEARREATKRVHLAPLRNFSCTPEYIETLDRILSKVPRDQLKRMFA